MRLVTAVIVLSAVSAPAQWLNHPDARIPRTKDGKPNLTAPAPRLNGKPHLSGVWQMERTPDKELASGVGDDFIKLQVDSQDVTPHLLNIFWGIKPADEPLRPAAADVLKQRRGQVAPVTRCLPPSIPMSLGIYALKMIQTPQEIVVLNEVGEPPRQIYTDGRNLPKDPDPTWIGYSVGNWQGETLVVDTIGLNDQAWIDGFGHPRSESMHITERYRRRDFGHLDLEIALDDPKYYTRPFTFKTGLNLLPDTDVLEFVCGENEKDRAHFVR